jgi:hypothetical protein
MNKMLRTATMINHQQDASTPMGAHQNFHNSLQPKRSPFEFDPLYPLIKRIPRSFKVLLNSQSRISGSLSDAGFYIRLPDSFVGPRLNLTVDAVLHASAPNNNAALESFPWSMHLTGLNNPFSYDSSTNNTTDVIALCMSRNYIGSDQRDLGGATCVDRSIFDRPVSVRFASPHMDIAAAIVNDWSLLLTIYDDSSAA